MNNFQQCMCANANLPDKYWGFAIVHAAYLWNVTPKAFLNGQTPKEMFLGQMPNVAQLQRFGCTAWVQAHTLLHRESGKLITSQDVVFDEGRGVCQCVVLKSYGDNPLPKEEGNNKSKAEVKTNNKNKADNKKDNAPKPVSVRQSSQSRRPPVQYRANVGAEYAWLANTNAILEALNAALLAPPKTFAKAMSWPGSPMWLASMTKELNLIEKHGMGKKVGRPTNKNIIKCKWVLGYKLGFSQRPGVNYTDVSSPVATSDASCVLLAKATSKDWEIIQLDIKTAFLHGKIKEEIYMEQPPGFKDTSSDYVWQLYNMLLMGTPQSFLNDTKVELGKSFKLVNLGKPKVFVGVKIN
ncbi:Retrovirus-related Pol polyprotein from transposon TNT 1-94 [Rhizoctonia solani]|uniref:Retrovirus-related Pol polyprotein from transposon TNT 1-94 n=1 Tax=Rhizoctonia solani TaxID=456999 RepID=A0A8H8NR94_9AGAM|nr:Retrovirus-related Pol polyprotein from transposon TNT 1-94 [Rhizoctonia solani]QRW18439.1 Retrovirus-related Pol polyprotein from transposon TNT 1-94 [Rhizoctonia solani]